MLQVLPGHFQIAFLTQVGIVLMVVWFVLEPWICGEWVEERTSGIAFARGTRQALAIGGCLIAVFPLAALQLWPTARLARLAAAQRDFEYLSGFAATPWHLVNYVAPGLFHRSPLWRPLVWDPFHTSPEEQLATWGWCRSSWQSWLSCTSSAAIARSGSWQLLAAVTLVLSLGPYVPGFRLLISVPGFSFFRAPARWSLATALALSILAGKGLDRCLDWPRPGRSLVWLTGLSAAWILVVLGLIELALGSGSSDGRPWLAGLFQKAFQSRPWTGDFRSPRRAGRSPQAGERPEDSARTREVGVVSPPPTRGLRGKPSRDLRARAGRHDGSSCRDSGRRLAHFASFATRALAGLLDLADIPRSHDSEPAPAGRCRAAAPPREPEPRSGATGKGAEGHEDHRRLSQSVDAGRTGAGRRLPDPRPACPGAADIWREAPLATERFRAGVRKAMRAAGVGVRVLDPVEIAIERWLARSKGSKDEPETIDDPILAGWIFGPDWRSEQGAWSSRFRIIHPESDPHRAWFLPLTAVSRPAMLEIWAGDLEPLLELFDQASPLREESRGTQLMDVSVDADAPGWVIITQLADPQWRARWLDRDGQGEFPAEILPTFRRNGSEGGWQRVRVPGPGRWTLHLEYVASDVAQGLAISSASLASLVPRHRRGRGSGKRKGDGVSGHVGVAIVGASGYAARELIQILLRHPGVKITVATSRQDEAPRLDALHPSLTRRIDLACEPFDADQDRRAGRRSPSSPYRTRQAWP